MRFLFYFLHTRLEQLQRKRCYQKMNVSLVGNITQPKYLRDSFSSAVTRNVIVVGLCISINYINGTLVHTFIKHEIFNGNPRYILFIHMVLNDMIQLMIAVVLHILSYTVFTLNVSFCCVLLMSVIFTTLNTPLNLATMAIERYIAICNPLRHAQICTVRKTYILISLIWVLSAIQVLPDLFILLATKPLTFFYSNIPCIRDYVFDNPYIVEKRNVVYIIYLTFVWLTIVYTYLKIMFVAKATNSDARKARSTIILHGIQLLMCMLTFVGPFLDRLLAEMFPLFIIDTRFSSYLVIQIMPRFISPIVYGMRDQMFCKYLKRYLLCTMFKMRRKTQNLQPSGNLAKVSNKSM
ncbi:olfactory receptor 8J3-like [Sinocyclocheilus anshuiensis]|uniref:olfactory receptor 8J3-like n=1 Tax=Sinocyclocheilus anshuiensis TaxID=1608454 RepID=UPI0007BA140A|nr:PREDICTED: olfactory receptor 8J3-like [Sinocyclocheilus anshuiensis]